MLKFIIESIKHSASERPIPTVEVSLNYNFMGFHMRSSSLKCMYPIQFMIKIKYRRSREVCHFVRDVYNCAPDLSNFVLLHYKMSFCLWCGDVFWTVCSWSLLFCLVERAVLSSDTAICAIVPSEMCHFDPWYCLYCQVICANFS
jgi:hypothetical protein